MNLWLYPPVRTCSALCSPERLVQCRGSLRKILPWVSLVLSMAVAGQVLGGSFSPPARPEVAPIISRDYPNDLNGNRINDELETRMPGRSELSIAAVDSNDPVALELIFSEPVTQRQIDAFEALGGRIIYMFQAVSYGWTGAIDRGYVQLLPAAMGPALVRAEPIRRVMPYMDLSSRTGRVRPIWQAGFAGNPAGFDGDPNTTIAFIDTGVDGTHPDLAGRCAYWRDFTDEQKPDPVDFEGHGTLVAGVALGTGYSGNVSTSTLRYTYVSPGSSSVHLVEPIGLPPGFYDIWCRAYWRGGTGILAYAGWSKGTLFGDLGLGDATDREVGDSPLYLGGTVAGVNSQVFSPVLLGKYSSTMLSEVVIRTSVSSYPAVGDGFARFRGVAPGCMWAAAKVARKDGEVDETTDGDPFAAALDDYVAHRTQLNIKIVSLSFGYHDENGLPLENVSTRDKVNTAVNNGVIVVAAAGNSNEAYSPDERKMADPARAAMAITVGATNDENALTSYSTVGFINPDGSEDCKSDISAPGGSIRYTGIMSVDSGSADGTRGDIVSNDYTIGSGTSFSAPFVAGCAALVIEALERQGVVWDFASSDLPRYVKMLLCATASETNAMRDANYDHPMLERASNGINGFPASKDAFEGYGIINPDAAVEAVCQAYAPNSEVSEELGRTNTAKRVWARTVALTGGRDLAVYLDNPADADFDLYLYGTVPSATGAPVLLASSTAAGAGADEMLRYAAGSDTKALLVVKRVSGAGTFMLRSEQAAPPTAQDVSATTTIGTPVTVTLQAVDDGSPIPPGALTFTIVSLPAHGRLENAAGGAAITQVPATLPASAKQVIYRPDAGYAGSDSFTFCAQDGGVPPFGGQSDVAAARISILAELTLEYQVSAGVDDASGFPYSTYQELNKTALTIGGAMDGVRFRNVQVPRGALIKSATLSICSYTAGLQGWVNATLRAEATDNAADFSTRLISTRTPTSASQSWNWGDDPWTPNTWYESPDIRLVIQDVVNRPGWSAGNAMTILYSCSDYEADRWFWSYDGAPAKAARLKITYQPR